MVKRAFYIAMCALALSFFNGCDKTELPEQEKPEVEKTPDEEEKVPEDEKTDDGVPEGFEEDADDTKADPVMTFNYSLLTKAGHPRLLCDAQGFAELKTKVTSGRFQYKTLYKLHSEVIARAKKIVESDRTFNSPWKSASDHYIIVDNLLSCAYAYKMTNQATYLAKVRRDMDKVSKLPNWDPSGLAIGEISMAMGLAYDWLYYDLTLAERQQARKAMLANGIKMMYNNNNNIKIVGNWNQINLGGVSVASMENKSYDAPSVSFVYNK